MPTPLLMLVELAFATTHESIAFCPAVIDTGEAVNDEIVGAPCGSETVAEHDVVILTEDASVTLSVIEWVPGPYAAVCELEVAPFPHRYA